MNLRLSIYDNPKIWKKENIKLGFMNHKIDIKAFDLEVITMQKTQGTHITSCLVLKIP